MSYIGNRLGRGTGRWVLMGVLVIVLGLVLGSQGQYGIASARPGELEQGTSGGGQRLYVLEAGSGEPSAGSRVAVLNSASGQLVVSIGTGYDPQMGLAPDGRRLYVADSEIGPGGAQTDRLRIIDTQNNYRVLRTVNLADRIRSPGDTGFPHVLVGSRDGRYVFTLQYSGARRDGMWPLTEYWVAAYDTLAERLLDSRLSLPAQCGTASLQPLRNSSEVAAVCPGPVLSVVFGDISTGSTTTLELPGKGGVWVNDVAGTAVSTDGGILYVVRRNATVHVIDTAARRLSQSLSLPLRPGEALAAPPEGPPPTGRGPAIHSERPQAPGTDAMAVPTRAAGVTLPPVASTPPPANAQPRRGFLVAYNNVAISPDGKQLFVGVRGPGPEAQSVAQQVWAYDTATWSRVSTVTLSRPTVSFAVSRDGQEVYPASVSTGQISVINTRTGSAHAEISAGIGRASLVLAGP